MSKRLPSAFRPFTDLAAAKRNGRGRARTTGRGRVRVRPRDLEEHAPANGPATTSTSFVFAAAATPNSDESRREILLRRLNEITQAKQRLERRQSRNHSKDSPPGNGVDRSVERSAPVRDYDPQPMDFTQAHFKRRDDLNVSADAANGTKRKSHSAPSKNRRNDPMEDVLHIPEPQPRHTASAHRNGKHPSSKVKPIPPPPPVNNPPPPPIDLDAVVAPSPLASLDSFTNDRSRQKPAKPPSPQGSPNLSARGSGRVRTPSVLLSSQPGEKIPSSSQTVSKNRQVGYCLRLVKDMTRLKDGYAFSRPIDQLWAVDQLPGYFDIVKHPMDLGTIRHRLENSFYMKSPGKDEVEEVTFDVDSFRSDMRLIFANAHSYNRSGDVFYDAATRLLEKFESKMAQMPSSEELEQQAAKKNKKRKKGVNATGETPAKRSSDATKKRKVVSKGGGGSDGEENGQQPKRVVSKKKPPAPSGGKSRQASNSTPKKKKASVQPEVVEPKDASRMSIPDMEVRLRALKRQRTLLQNGSPASPPAGGGASYMAQAQALYHVEMTFQEKVLLSNNVGKLPPDKLQKIVALATKTKGSSMEVNFNDEIELDIDSMNNETLREMEAYVNQILSKKKRGSVVASPNADILQMTASQISTEIEKVMVTLRKRSKGKSKELGGEEGKGGPKDKKQKSFYDTDSSSDSDDESDGSGSGSSDDSSSGSSDDESDDESDQETMRQRRERNLAHQKAMQASGTPLPSPPYQDSMRSS